MATPDPELVDAAIEWLDGPADSVAVRGTFSADSSQWWLDTIALAPGGGGGDSHRAVLRLRPGRYEFKFVIDGTEWRVSPSRYPTAVDAHGNVNNVLVVPGDGHRADVAISDASERSGLLEARPAGSSSSYGSTSARSRAPSNAPGTEPGYRGSAAPPRCRLKRVAVGVCVVALFALLGAVSALYDGI
ncbi:hypothetical protein IWQ56_007004 [Coemansia nantahalensis]|uniref:Uncharacterized protein n=1 Tax=Coemansia nantahalensis TaxID=2789366 RepID=A0ACC1K8J1_9FUNG|nr:hypothetical protein IWQ56_007004 [Coemansia nantahalensis]KAJ2775871.1 hypothetical protein IWQ57_000028 [Coemansia nantahalensis]